MELPELPTIHHLEARMALACSAARPVPAAGVLGVRTLFVLLYAGAVGGSGRWLRPNQVVRMTDEQSARTAAAERVAWADASSRPRFEPQGRRWYAENTRESVREVLTTVLLPIGAVVERPGLAPTSPAPRWALHAVFAAFLCAGDDRAARALSEWLQARSESSPESAAAQRLASSLTRTASAAEAFALEFPSAAGAAHAREAARHARAAAAVLLGGGEAAGVGGTVR